MKRCHVLFLCTGNICRSPMAEAIFRHKLQNSNLSSKVTVDSAGTIGYHQGETADRRTLSVLKQHGVSFPSRARQITKQDLTQSDLIIAMDKSHLETLNHLLQDAHHQPRVALMMDFASNPSTPEVPDPYYEGGFDRVYQLIDQATDGLLSFVQTQIKSSPK